MEDSEYLPDAAAGQRYGASLFVLGGTPPYYWTEDLTYAGRTDLSSVPIAVSAIPVIGPLLVMRFFGKGIWLGAEEGILHDWLRRPDKITGLPPVPARVAHRIFRGALYKRGYPPDLCELYYQAVLRFNS